MGGTFSFDLRRSRKFPWHGFAAMALFLLQMPSALAWGDMGHEVVVRIALHYLAPAARQRMDALLDSDPDPLTAHDPVSEAVWADRFRDSPENGYKTNYYHTHLWHFVDMDLFYPNMAVACNNFTSLPPGVPASEGPSDDCVVDKIEQFSSELRAYPAHGATPAQTTEARLALKYLLHFAGDLHQPLHTIDDHDRGGNDRKVIMRNVPAGSLHHYWDTVFVEQLGPDSASVATTLLARITPANVQAWQKGTPGDWAKESYLTAKLQAYAPLPRRDNRGRYRLNARYREEAIQMTAVQLEEAGVRLAWLLNRAL